jgi:hypothetical protein
MLIMVKSEPLKLPPIYSGTTIWKPAWTSTEPIWLESDYLATVQALNSNIPNRSQSCIIIEQAKETLRLFQDFKVTKCHRSANGVAYALRQFSRRVFSSCFLSEGVPTCALEALEYDCNHAYGWNISSFVCFKKNNANSCATLLHSLLT